MRAAPTNIPAPSRCELRRRLERLDGLPLRAETARSILQQPDAPDGHAMARPGRDVKAPFRLDTEVDPGWVVALARVEKAADPLALVAARGWWPVVSRAVGDSLGRLWRHGMAVALAAFRLAREAQIDGPERVARAGLLHQLGVWCAAAAEPEWLPRWLAVEGPSERRAFEQATLGTEVGHLGRTQARRWGFDSLVADAAWLHDLPSPEVLRRVEEPALLEIVQAAYRLAEQTPWALHPRGGHDRLTHDPRLKLLMAEVQSRCRGAFLDPEATPREERLTRENARLRVTLRAMSEAQATRDRLLEALSQSDPEESPEIWADRAAQAWCAEPGVTAARVEWGPPGSAPTTEEDPESASSTRGPSHRLSLTTNQRPGASLSLWWAADGAAEDPTALATTLPAWRAWAASVTERERLRRRLEGLTAALRERVEDEEPRQRAAKLDALAEFAAGAGHELNNPLAVIVGRAQLLLAKADDPATVRSLRAILTQAQRAHRILRDLMYVARPPEPRPRPCTPDEIWRASLRDARPEAEERGIVFSTEGFDAGRRVWVDPDGLRHLADMLLRNAMEATPRGGAVRVSSVGNSVALRWSVQDTGRGLLPGEAAHLFDPFYCGRQAGRGLGLGLPRAARFLELAGGGLTWHATPGQGASFVVTLPPSVPPRLPGEPADAPDDRFDRRRSSA